MKPFISRRISVIFLRVLQQKINLHLLITLIIRFHLLNKNVYFKLYIKHPAMLYTHKKETNTVKATYFVLFSTNIITQATLFHQYFHLAAVYFHKN
jgi:hypothetical protein